jgi:hypothetical protein
MLNLPKINILTGFLGSYYGLRWQALNDSGEILFSLFPFSILFWH